MSQRDDQQFLKLYQKYRYEDQLSYYLGRQGEFTHARTQAIFISIGLVFLAAIAGALGTVDILWLKLTCLLAAAICPVLATALAAYNALYAFEQQAKLYQDAINNLARARVLVLNMGDPDFAAKVDNYVQEVEKIFLTEQGQWGQLAKRMRPHET